MTDNEIIKALECCSKAKTPYDCERLECPCFNNPNICIFSEEEGVILSALDLINRLQAKNEGLGKEVDRLSQAVMYNDSITEMKVDEAKAEAYKEFADWLKEKPTQYFYETNRDMTIPLVSFDRIDNLLKKLVGE